MDERPNVLHLKPQHMRAVFRTHLVWPSLSFDTAVCQDFQLYFPRCLWTCEYFDRRGWTEEEEEGEGGGSRHLAAEGTARSVTQSPFLCANREDIFTHDKCKPLQINESIKAMKKKRITGFMLCNCLVAFVHNRPLSRALKINNN